MAATPEHSDEEQSGHAALIGSSVRARRKEVGLTMVQVAQATELSQGFLSRIETGRVLPSVMTIYRLAEALGCTPAQLMPTTATDTDHRLVRGGEALHISERPERDLTVTPLGRSGPGDQLEAYLYEFEHHTTKWWPYRQETVLYVLSGTVAVESADGRRIVLAPGDSLHFHQDSPTRWVAEDGPVRMLGCHGPPLARHDLAGLPD